MQNILELYSKIKNIDIMSKKLSEGFFTGKYQSVFRGSGLEFNEVKEYQDGDDSKHIDWNVTSRMNGVFSKSFKEEREQSFFFIMDVSPSIDVGVGKISRRDMIGIISSILSFSAVYNNDQVGAIFFSDKIEKVIPPMKGHKQVSRIANAMLKFNAEGQGSDLAIAIETLLGVLYRKSICVILSDFKTSKGWHELSLLAKKHDVIAIKIVDPLDFKIPMSCMFSVIDAETKERGSFYGFHHKQLAKYEEFWKDHHSRWIKECQKRGVSSLVIDTNTDPIKSLIHFFRRRRFERG